MAAPIFQSAVTTADGTKVILTYDKALSATTAGKGKFKVRSGGSDNTVTGVAINGANVELTVTNVIKRGQAVHASYRDPTDGNDANAVQDASGADAITLNTTIVNNQSTIQPGSALGPSVKLIGDVMRGGFAGAFAGNAVSLSQDGTIAAVGSYAKHKKDLHTGSVTVYKQVGSTWIQHGDPISGAGNGDTFGTDLSLSGDGMRLAVGAARNDGNGKNSGHVRVFELKGKTWTKLGDDIEGENKQDLSGNAVALSRDGTTVAIGSKNADDKHNLSGHVRIFKYTYDAGKDKWEWIRLGNQIPGTAQPERFGWSVDLSSDGKTVAVGAPYRDREIQGKNSPDHGRVVVYDFDDKDNDDETDDVWVKRDTLWGPGEKSLFGYSVALSDDGLSVASGAPFYNGKRGYAKVNKWKNNKWEQVGGNILNDQLQFNRGLSGSDFLGYSVSLSAAGEHLAVSAHGFEKHEKNKGNLGAAHIYRLDGNSWTYLDSAIGVAAQDKAGRGITAVNLSGDGTRIALGAQLNDFIAKDAGHTRVYDINNNGPALTAQTPAVREDANHTYQILDLDDSNTTTDKDPDGDAIIYSITAGNTSGLFAINSSDGKLSIAPGKSIDYETATSHALTIKASDGVISTTAIITISVTNINDNAPDIGNTTKTFAEDKAPNVSLLDLKDSHTNNDKDRDGDAITYSITAGNESGLFSIDGATGDLKITNGKSLDFESATSHSLTIQASDGTKTDNATITINVTNINDNDPSIADATIPVDEDKLPGFTVTDINDSYTSDDKDRDDDAITYSITAGNTDGIFSINGATGLIKIADGKSLDYDTASSHSLTILATDGTNTDTATIQINVSNTDANAPSIANANPSIEEDADPGALIIDINDSNTSDDTDNDGDALTYSITAGNTAGLFAINSSNGKLSIAPGKSLDYETATSHALTIKASDGTKTDNATITINVTNVNDNAPAISDTTKAFAEDQAPNVSLLDLKDSHTNNDKDRDGDAITYSITAGNDAGIFSINGATGDLKITNGKSLDFESATSHSLTIQASDGTKTDNATITINVTNINDNAPAISNTTKAFAEDQAPNVSLLDLKDSHTNNDKDRDGDAITYSITAGNDAGIFSIDGATGDLKITNGKSLDFESATSHSLTIQASDGTKTDNATITINVSNVNDNGPSIADATVEVLETINADSEIIDLKDSISTTDTDRDGDAISYSIKSGNAEGLFAIATTTGKITLAKGKSLDFDTKDQHILEIQATDGSRTDTATLTINVIDSNTAPTAVDDSFTLNENATVSKNASNGIIQSNDTDAQSDALTISSFQTSTVDDPATVLGAFNVPLDGDYGQLTLLNNGSFDYVANRAAADALAAGESAVDTFTYTISDGKLSNTAEINFTINGINDAPILVDAIKTKKYTEGQSNVTVIDGSLTIRDVDDTNIETATIAITGAFQPTEDTLGFVNNFGITGAWNQGTGVLTLTGSTTKANYESALQTVTYTNSDNANPVLGLRTVTWTINDGSANSTGITSKIDVGGVNDSPEAVNEAVALNAGSSVSTTAGQANLLANDTDPEGNALNIHTFRLGQEQDSNPDFAAGGTITGLYGQLTIGANGTYTYNANQPAAQRLLSGETRTETFNYTIHDTSDAEDLGEITFTLTGINDKPSATDDTKQINENDNKFFSNVQGLLINDTDLDGDPLEVTTIRPGLETGNDVGVKTIGDDVQGTYGSLNLQSDGSYRFNANSSNVDALDAGDVATDIFTYTLSDTQLEDKAEIRINVKGINDAPVLSAITSGSVADQANSKNLTSSNLTGKLSASDADASASLSYGISSVNTARSFRNAFHARHAFQARHTGQSKNAIQGNSTTSMSGSYGQLNIDSNTGAYTYTPNTASVDNLDANQTVTETFALFVSDGSLRSTQNFSVQITGASDAASSSGNNRPTSSTDQPTNTNTDTDTDVNADTDNDGVPDSFEKKIDPETQQPFDRNNDGIPDYQQRSVATFASTSGKVTSLSNRHSTLIATESIDQGSIRSKIAFLFRGISAKAEQLAGLSISNLQNSINRLNNKTNSQSNQPIATTVIRTSDQPSFRLIPELIIEGNPPQSLVDAYQDRANQRFANMIHRVDYRFEEDNFNWNTLFKPDETGELKLFGYDPITGLGGILTDRDGDGRPDGATVFLKDNDQGDTNPEPFVIDDPLGAAELQSAPKLISTSDGRGLVIEGLAGQGLWVRLKTNHADADWQNSLQLISNQRGEIGSIGATQENSNLGFREIYLQSGEELRFQQSSNNRSLQASPSLILKKHTENESWTLGLEDKEASDHDYNDLEISISGHLTPEHLGNHLMARSQKYIHSGVLDLQSHPGDTLTLKIEASSDSGSKNRLAFVQFDDNTDALSINGIEADGSEAFQEMVRQSLINPNEQQIELSGNRETSLEWTIQSSDYGLYAPVLLTSMGTVHTAENLSSSQSPGHLKLLGMNHFAFEDRVNGDWDYNDLTVQISML